MIRKRKKGRSKIKATPVRFKGIYFKSKLERTMYMLLCDADIEAQYEKEVFVLLQPFHSPNDSYEKNMNGKGVFGNKGGCDIKKMYYTPDFTGYDFIIETKGRANERFPLIWKLFKHHLVEIKDTRTIYKPTNNKECMTVVDLIKKKRIK